jgi:tRNA A-37 threonylcarbamoyl transferase component Bud32
VPAGYERLVLSHAMAVARSDVAESVRATLIGADGTRTTLLEYAAGHPLARTLQGRGAAFAVPLPYTDVRVVVRHNRHGGAFAGLTRDLFLQPTRAPRELAISRALRERGVPTPEILAYAVYPPGGVLQRSDVCSHEIAPSRDLAAVIQREEPESRFPGLELAAALVATLSRAGARHHDLNAKNVLVSDNGAYVLDVDRVTFGEAPASAMEKNLARLVRSLRKWRDIHGAPITEPEIAQFAARARGIIAKRS